MAQPTPPRLTARVGRGIVATRAPSEAAALECIRELGLDWHHQQGCGDGAAAGVDEATGLFMALEAIKLTSRTRARAAATIAPWSASEVLKRPTASRIPRVSDSADMMPCSEGRLALLTEAVTEGFCSSAIAGAADAPGAGRGNPAR